MKKLYFSALSLVFGLSLNAQTINQGNHAPTNGDQFSTFQCDSTINPGASGAGVVWTYSALVTHSSTVSNYTTSTVNNPVFAGANVATASSTSNITYLKASGTELKNYGGYLNLNGVGATVNYTVPFVSMPYPTSLNTTTTSLTSGTLSVYGTSGTFNGTATILGDGTGTLILPAKTFSSVIRVLTTQTLNFVAAGVSGTITQKTFDWYSLGDSKYPILSDVTSYVNAPPIIASSTQTYLTVQKNYQTVGLKEEANREQVSVSVYPNPSHATVSFVTESTNAKSVLIYDVTGKFIESQSLSSGKTSLNVSNYNSGLYIYKLVNGDNAVLKSGKITVTH